MRRKKVSSPFAVSPLVKLIISIGTLICLTFVLYLYHLPAHDSVNGMFSIENRLVPTNANVSVSNPLPVAKPIDNSPLVVPPLVSEIVSPPPEIEIPQKQSISLSEKIKELFEIGKQNPSKLIHILQDDNPFDLPSTVDSFICPTSSEMLISSPNLINHTRAQEFRQGKPGTWLFYQHLRKAGGTGFCDLAQNNLPRQQTPPYFCMIDNRGSLATSPWNNEEYLMSRMERSNYRITANEWDAYYPYMGQWRGAVLATTFRHPVDRWYSQYRFEHLEHRDGSKQDAPRRPFRTWYNNNKGWTMGINYYVTTFIGLPDVGSYNKGDFYWSYHKYQKLPLSYEMFLQSLHHILTFHLILITEWLDTSPPLIEEVLGWKTPPKPVLPHESNAAKRDGSYRRIPIREVIGEEDYQAVLEENIFDLLLFRIVQRVYLERLHHCHSSSQGEP